MMLRTEHALKLYALAWTLVKDKARSRLVGSDVVKEYNFGVLTVRHGTDRDILDVWSARKVLSVEHWAGKLFIIRYEPGAWEMDLAEAAN